MLLTVTFAYLINTIGAILSEMQKDGNELKLKLNNINHYMKIRGVNSNLQARIRRHI